MTEIQHIKEWLVENPFVWSIIKFAFILVIVLIAMQVIRRYLKQRISNTVIRYKAQKSIEILGYVLLVILAVTYFSGTIKNFTIIIGLFTAGIAFTLQELILSVAGSVYIFLVKVYSYYNNLSPTGYNNTNL
jgi:hypothetical protein